MDATCLTIVGTVITGAGVVLGKLWHAYQKKDAKVDELQEQRHQHNERMKSLIGGLHDTRGD